MQWLALLVLNISFNFQIKPDHPDWLSCPGQEVRDLSISHPFKLDSACGTPEYTTYTIGFKDCLDYIFYQVKFSSFFWWHLVVFIDSNAHLYEI